MCSEGSLVLIPQHHHSSGKSYLLVNGSSHLSASSKCWSFAPDSPFPQHLTSAAWPSVKRPWSVWGYPPQPWSPAGFQWAWHFSTAELRQCVRRFCYIGQKKDKEWSSLTSLENYPKRVLGQWEGLYNYKGNQAYSLFSDNQRSESNRWEKRVKFGSSSLFCFESLWQSCLMVSIWYLYLLIFPLTHLIHPPIPPYHTACSLQY